MIKEIYALGVGHGTPLFIELAEACGYKVVGLYHYNETRTGEYDHVYEILGDFADLMNFHIKGKSFMLTMGDMNIKNEISDNLIHYGGILPTLIHPTAVISKFVQISDSGVLINSHCEIHSDTKIDEGCVLWPRSTIEHDCRLHKYVFVGPNAYVGAYTEISDRAFIGQCSILMSNKAQAIGSSALVGAGALVTKPVPANSIVAGHPARLIKTL